MTELGIRAHDLPIFDETDKLAQALRDYHLYNIQFSAKFSLKKETNGGNNMSFGLAHRSASILKRAGINVVVFGCYINMIHPDRSERQKAISLFKNYLAYSKSINCPLVGTETGSFNNIFKPQKENYTEKVFEETVTAIKELVETAEKLGVLVGIEPGVNHPIHDVKSTRKILDEIDSPNLKVIFDPMNMVSSPKDNEARIVENGINSFGNEIYCFHIKDYNFKDNQKVVVPFGDGLAPMKEIAKEIKTFKPDPYILMEETPQEEFSRSVDRFLVTFR